MQYLIRSQQQTNEFKVPLVKNIILLTGYFSYKYVSNLTSEKARSQKNREIRSARRSTCPSAGDLTFCKKTLFINKRKHCLTIPTS